MAKPHRIQVERHSKRGFFLDGHERKDVVEYRETFQKEIKSLLPYLVEFRADGIIIPKEYPDDCAVGGQIDNQLS